MNEKNSERVESFTVDHTKLKAPFVRVCSVLRGKCGDTVTKYDIRFMQPNKEEMLSDGIHTLEHLLATYLRDDENEIIDISPMGCRTGFYMTMWGKRSAADIAEMITEALEKVVTAQEIPAANEVQCGNFRLHSLERAKEYARKVLREGLREMKE